MTDASRTDRAADAVGSPPLSVSLRPAPQDPVKIDVVRLSTRARAASRFLKTLANQHRLMILCHLTEREHSVGELEQELGIQQAHLSQQLARLRREGLVRARRESRQIYYSLGSEEAREMIATLYRLFCRDRSSKHSA
jgi:DNA-binding transcriptional ArsR family regulator